MRLKPEVLRAAAWGILFTGLTTVAIAVGSRNLNHFDAALVAYTFATLFVVFGVTYRYAMWLQRPPTALYWRRGWHIFFRCLPQNYSLRHTPHNSRTNIAIIDL